MKKLCIIPARGGSKRFPGKNVAKLGKKPLIFHTIDATLGLFDRIIITTDSINILELVKNEYASYSFSNETELIFHLRDSSLATDTSKVIETVKALQQENKDCDEVWLTLPTCPLRTRGDIQEAQQLLTKDVDSVIAVTEYEFPPSLGMVEGAGGNLISYHYSDPWRNGNTRSQDHAQVLRPNGSIYGTTKESFETYQSFYDGKVKGYFMPRERSVDIDTKIDFKLAGVLYETQRKQHGT
jgi:CMP-N-acetylneuraminic acid synthetase